MNLLLSKKSDSSKRLLPSQKQGLFGKKKKTYARSEEEKIENLAAYEVPVGFDVGGGTSKSPVHQIVTTTTTADEHNEDNETHISDITADRTYKRAVEQYHMEQQRKSEFLDPPGDMARTQSDALNTIVEDPGERGTTNPPGSFMAQLMGVVDQACAPAEGSNDDIRKVLSFSPEWGVAPDGDDTIINGPDKELKPEWKEPERYSIALTRDPQSMEMVSLSQEGDIPSNAAPDKPKKPLDAPAAKEESPPRVMTPTFDVTDRTASPTDMPMERFELILDESDLKAKPKKKGWLPFGKKSDKEMSDPAVVVKTPTQKNKAPRTPPTAKLTPPSQAEKPAATSTKAVPKVASSSSNIAPKQNTNSAPSSTVAVNRSKPPRHPSPPKAQGKRTPSPTKKTKSPVKKSPPRVQVKSRKAMAAAAKVTAKKNANAKKNSKTSSLPVPSTVHISTAAESTPVKSDSPNQPPAKVPSDTPKMQPSSEEKIQLPPKAPVVEPDEFKAKETEKKSLLHKVRSFTRDKKEQNKTPKQPQNASTDDSPKEAKLKQVLVAFHGAAKGPLAIIEEEDVSPDSSVNEATELKVRVPGGGGAVLRDGDLIGNEIVEDSESQHTDSNSSAEADEEIERIVTPPRVSRAAAVPEPEIPVKDADSLDKAPKPNVGKTDSKPQLSKKPEVTSVFRDKQVDAIVSSRPTEIETTIQQNGSEGSDGKTKTWKERLGFTRARSSDSGERRRNDVSQSPLRRQVPAPETVGVTGKRKSARSRKNPWKVAVDPSNGREYYYHRVTRQTTWNKPAELCDQQAGVEFESEVKKILPEPKLGATKSDQESSNDSPTRDSDVSKQRKKNKIARLLATMSPPDGESVERLIAKYDGREDELLASLQEVKESDSTPFDEPMGPKRKSQEDEDEGVASVSTSSIGAPIGLNSRTQTANSYRSGASGFTRLSEKTPQIQNTSRSKRRIDPIKEDDTPASSIASKENQDAAMKRRTVIPFSRKQKNPGRVPSKVPVHRSRELQVEEFTDGFRQSNIRGVVRSTNKKKQLLSLPRKAKPVPPPFGYDGSVEGDRPGNDTSTVSHDDNISALSMTDVEFLGRGVGSNSDQEAARRRAFDDAVAREDWDLAAALSEGMRALKKRGSGTRRPPPPVHREWTQSELDRFISENDWDAVANYVATVRSKNKSSGYAQKTRKTYSNIPRPRVSDASYSDDSQVRKRFGARSQLQHAELHSYSSWESSSYDESEDYSSGSYSSDDRRYRRHRRRDNFAC